MQTEEHNWYSPKLARDMAVKIYGHWGQPIIAFPCSRGRYFDYEGMGMIEAIAPFIDGGHIKLYCVDSVDSWTWYDFSVAPAERNSRHEQYDQYITEEVVPFIYSHCKTDDSLRIMTNGCSMGAYHGLNFFLRHPHIFAGTISLSGLYRLDRQEFGIGEADLGAVYHNSPITYLPALTDPWYLEWYRRSTIVICTGQGAWEEEALEDTRTIDTLLRKKSIAASVDYWGYDVNHDWPWWFKQMNYFLSRIYR